MSNDSDDSLGDIERRIEALEAGDDDDDDDNGQQRQSGGRQQTAVPFSGSHDYLESRDSENFSNNNNNNNNNPTAVATNRRLREVSFGLCPSNSIAPGGVAPGDDMIGTQVTNLQRHTYPGAAGAGNNSRDDNNNNHTSSSSVPPTNTSRPGAYSVYGRPVGFFTSRRYRNRNRRSSPAEDSQSHLPPEMRVPRGRRSRFSRQSRGGGSGPRPSSGRMSVMQRFFSTMMFAGDATVVQTPEQVGGAEQNQVVEEQQQEKKKIRKEIWIIVICFIIAVIVAVVVAVTMVSSSSGDEKNKNKSSTNDKGLTTPSSTTDDADNDDDILSGDENVRITALRAIVKHLTTDQSVLYEITSPQYQAMKWIAMVDLAEFEWDDTKRLETRYALATVYYATSGSEWFDNHTFLSSTHECDWSSSSSSSTTTTTTTTAIMNDRPTTIRGGVSCNLTTMDVTSLNLENNNLMGSLPEEIKALSSLHHLTVASNLNQQMDGTYLANLDLDNLIDTVAPIRDLIYLDMSNNMWDGIIPSSIGVLSNIEVLHLEMNTIKFTIPSTFSSLSKLKELHLDGNVNLIGGIENVLGSMGQLEVLNVTGCDFTISPELKFPTSMTTLGLGGNHFDQPAALSTEIGRLSNLKVLSLDGIENLQGTIPSDLGMMTNLEVLRLGNNNGLGGPCPWASLPTSSIREVHLHSTDVHGQLPSDISKYSALEVLNLQMALFRGIIPDSIGNLTSLVIFDIFGNGVEGQIPSTVGMMSSLERFDVAWNKLSGRVPVSMANMESLVSLSLQGNALLTEGNIEFLCSREDSEGIISHYQNITCSCCQIME